MSNKIVFLVINLFMCSGAFSQPDRWQQRVKYTMNIDMNVLNNRFAGKQKLEYTNNSPDTLAKVYYHLYFNAFQPGSMMDSRSRRQGTLIGGRGQDWDSRIKDRIQNLKPDEIGYQKIISLKMNGRPQLFSVLETILEVKLDKPILPRSKVVFEMDFEAQVPLQIRRSGRDNPTTKVRYSMSQWYPKLCEYDYEGWHPTPYVGREFYGVWGDFDVSITIDKKYILGGTGYLQNPNQIGYGYEDKGAKVKRPPGDKLTWRFMAPNVHDFMWAADPGYIHASRKLKDSLTVHVLYKPTNEPSQDWEDLLTMAEKALPFIEKTFGVYPYKQFSFIHGGDGGMEYPMATLCIGPGAALHEWMHSWYYGLLGTNESLYSWMDEGFTQYAEERVYTFLNNRTGFSQADAYAGYYSLVKSGKEEPLTTHADHYNTNAAYGAASYLKGAVFVEQLGYIVGAPVRDKILLEYYKQWRFKHPNAADFFRIAEKVSDMKLDWYKEYWINSTKTINYGIDSLWEEGGNTKIRLSRIGLMPMPIDLQITFKDGTKELHYVPMNLMYGEKPAEDMSLPRKVYEPWKWTHSTYIIETTRKLADFTIVEIDPSLRLADVERQNNKLELKW
ncbi:MAG: M1 family metallopeptidase [Chitinophagaceae bacterium]|nr:M1 family metallopeptidase [Chitinophagaceae bacterium]MBK9570477.1 M1 family metallopeptidase [Chitinophagaceae bacterium]MBL0272358.1 M1 family metallopeptidase [Chitinophagaceae bacterium]